MNVSQSALGRWVAAWVALSGMTVSAELPGLPEMPWVGHFVGYQNKKLQFGITAQGKATLKLIGKKGDPLTKLLSISVEFLVEEIMPDGSSKVRELRPETLESAQAATERPQNLVFHGKVKGDAGFEVTVSEDRGIVSLGGRLLDSGTLKKNPLRFSIRLKIPDAYPYQKASGDKKVIKAFEEKTKSDRLQLTWTDGKRVKPPTDKPVDAGSKDFNGPGIAAAQIEFSSYQEKRLEISASPNSIITLSSARPAPLREGFFLTWVADPAKDPEARAHLSFEVR